MSKEPGQMAYKAWFNATGFAPYSLSPREQCLAWAAVESAIRADERAKVLEECALREQELRQALAPFADYASKDGFGLNHKGEELPDWDGVGWVYLTNGDFRRACAALADQDSPAASDN